MLPAPAALVAVDMMMMMMMLFYYYAGVLQQTRNRITLSTISNTHSRTYMVPDGYVMPMAPGTCEAIAPDE